MKKSRLRRIDVKLNLLTSKWWFTLLIVLAFFVPSYTTKFFDPAESAKLVIAVLSNALVYSKPILLPIFKIVPIIVFGLLFKYRNKVSRLFSGYVIINFLIVTVFQNMAYTKEYGFAILIGNMIVSLIVAMAWLWETIMDKNSYEKVDINKFKLLIIGLALLSYWYPINMETLNPDFNPLYLLTSEAGLTFCMLVPIYLTVLILIYPNVNYLTLKVTSLVGFIMGILNVVQFFVLNPFLFWFVILHLP